jgi:altronate hydrolase
MGKNDPLTIRLNPLDNVVVARVELPAGTEVPEEGVTCRRQIPAGHKLCTAAIGSGVPVRKYGQIIGFATSEIFPGEHVHTHNLGMGNFTRDYAIGVEARPTDYVHEGTQATFRGIVRPDGRVATRNYIGVICTANCSTSVARYIADSFGNKERAEFPNVDGVVPVCHGSGCAMAASGEGFKGLQRTLVGYARHGNFAGALIIGLGCEVNQIDSLLQSGNLKRGPLLQTLTIQDIGGTSATIREGVSRIREMLPEANRMERRPVPVSHLILGLECGGSDAYSGITANPALGAAVDLLVRHGGTAVLSETPEIYGAEHLLTRRAVNRKIGDKLIALIRWWEDYVARNGVDMDNNPSPGNKAGGLTTILEKSLGAAAKGGTTNLVDVYQFAEPITAKGFVFMDTPGYDPTSVTGMVAGGANVICFTTGCGSVFGCRPVPSIKLATNTALYQHMEEDMDINCGTIADGEITVEKMGERIFRFMLETASGRETKSEIHGIGDNEFVPWQIGAVM